MCSPCDGDGKNDMTETPVNPENGFRQLLNGLLDGRLTPEQMRQLEHQIQAGPEAMKMYIETVILAVGLRKYSQAQRGAMMEALRQPPDESELWRTMADEEKQAPAIKMAKQKKWFRPKPKTVPIQQMEKNIHRVNRHISRLPISVLIAASAALILMLVYIQLFPLQTVATLNDSVNAVWDNRVNEFKERRGLYPAANRQMLKKGFAQVQFQSGVEVIFEAPCEFVLEDKEQLFLKQGKVFVRVPEEAIGFSVRTPSCRVIDLGTEFGVSVEQDGTSQIQMLSGKASLVAGLAGQKKEVSELVLAGQARKVEAATGKISMSAFLQDQFAQRIDSSTSIVWRGQKSLSLADIIAGGDGLQTNRRGCLNPVSGVIESETRYLTPEEMRNPPQTYNAVQASPFINGIFVPNGKNGPVKVSSADHRFAFPPTSATIWYPVTAITYYVTDKNEGSQSPGPGMLPEPAFYLHSNLGVTFDLNAIRKAYHGMKITGFRTQYGIRWDGTPHSNKVDFWVLVDGQNRHEHRAKTAGTKMEEAYIPLGDTDRFLTVATTEANDGLGYDWGIFVNPVIELTKSAEIPY
jgi:hypothetical protein